MHRSGSDDISSQLRAGAAPAKDAAFFWSLASVAAESVAPERTGARRGSRALRLAAVAASTSVIISGVAYAGTVTFGGAKGTAETPSSTNPRPADSGSGDHQLLGDEERPKTATPRTPEPDASSPDHGTNTQGGRPAIASADTQSDPAGTIDRDTTRGSGTGDTTDGDTGGSGDGDTHGSGTGDTGGSGDGDTHGSGTGDTTGGSGDGDTHGSGTGDTTGGSDDSGDGDTTDGDTTDGDTGGSGDGDTTGSGNGDTGSRESGPGDGANGPATATDATDG